MLVPNVLTTISLFWSIPPALCGLAVQSICGPPSLAVSKEKGKRKPLTAKNSTKKVVEEVEIVTKVGVTMSSGGFHVLCGVLWRGGFV